MENEIKVNEYISRKEFLKKNDSNVAYSLLVQNNIKSDDYARLNTGLICRVIGIRENSYNKKAIYFGVYEQDWFDCSAVENFSNNLKDLIEIGDLVKIEDNCGIAHWFEVYENSEIYQYEILEVVTKKMMETISYKV